MTVFARCRQARLSMRRVQHRASLIMATDKKIEEQDTSQLPIRERLAMQKVLTSFLAAKYFPYPKVGGPVMWPPLALAMIINFPSH